MMRHRNFLLSFIAAMFLGIGLGVGLREASHESHVVTSKYDFIPPGVNVTSSPESKWEKEPWGAVSTNGFVNRRIELFQAVRVRRSPPTIPNAEMSSITEVGSGTP